VLCPFSCSLLLFILFADDYVFLAWNLSAQHIKLREILGFEALGGRGACSAKQNFGSSNKTKGGWNKEMPSEHIYPGLSA
jgi:hypothetical protein